MKLQRPAFAPEIPSAGGARVALRITEVWRRLGGLEQCEVRKPFIESWRQIESVGKKFQARELVRFEDHGREEVWSEIVDMQ